MKSLTVLITVMIIAAMLGGIYTFQQQKIEERGTKYDLIADSWLPLHMDTYTMQITVYDNVNVVVGDYTANTALYQYLQGVHSHTFSVLDVVIGCAVNTTIYVKFL